MQEALFLVAPSCRDFPHAAEETLILALPFHSILVWERDFSIIPYISA